MRLVVLIGVNSRILAELRRHGSVSPGVIGDRPRFISLEGSVVQRRMYI